MRRARHLIGDRRALTDVDAASGEAHEQTIASQAATRS